MNNTNRHFDFSLDDSAFKERLKKQLLALQKETIDVLSDDDLEYIHAAGTGTLPPTEEGRP